MLKKILFLISGLSVIIICGVYYRQPMGLFVGALLIATAFFEKEEKNERNNL